VCVQKSRAEGFGLVIAEAMWKRRPVVASRVGGIQDQIEDASSGVLVDDPADGAAFAVAIARFLNDPALAEATGERARQRVAERFLSTRQLTETMNLVSELKSRG
jgi:trehalose synthase